jgi:adenosylcobinamide-phosphate synthase
LAARLDDLANWIPARLTALAIVGGARLQGLDGDGALRIWRRDGSKHASPNAGQSEAAIAGVLGVRLGGINSYEGQPHVAPVLCAEGRPATTRDARSAWSMAAIVSGLAFAAAMVVLAVGRRET